MSMPPLPSSIDTINPRQWQTFQPYAEELQQRPLSPQTINQWLADWSALIALIQESGSMLYVKKTIDIADADAEQAFLDFIRARDHHCSRDRSRQHPSLTKR